MTRQFEQDFYEFVKQQLQKKRRQNESASVEEDLEKNRQQNANIQKILLAERKRMKINKVSKEQQFEKRMRDFAQMGTFIDVSKFIKGLNSPRDKKKPESLKAGNQKNVDSDNEDQDIFDYEEIVTKTKKLVAKKAHLRTKPNIKGYLVQDYGQEFKTQEIEEVRTDDMQFYSGIDKLITDIHHQEAQNEQDLKYEVERKRHRDSLRSVQHLQQLYKYKSEPVILNDFKDQEVANKEKEFREKSRKVLHLLEKTTKQLYSNKRRPFYEFNSKRTQKTSKNVPTNESVETKLENNNKSRSVSKVSQSNYPYHISPNSSTISRKMLILPKLSHPSIPEEWTYTPHNVDKKGEHTFKTQLDEFLIKVDRTKADFQKAYPTEKQLQHIQSKMRRNLNRIGKQPVMESLKMLGGNRQFQFRSQHRPSKKSRMLQIL